MRDPGGQARGSGLVGGAQPQRARERPHAGLGQPRLGQGTQDLVLGCRHSTGTIDPDRIVGVLAVGDVRESLPLGDVVADAREQFVLAVEAAIRAVRPVFGLVTLTCGELDEP